MPGARPRNLRRGDAAERLAEFVLGAFAFTTSVPRQEDVGHDFYCALIDPNVPGPNLIAGPSFVVQVKSRKVPIKYQGTSAIDWISNQENPLFVCYVDLDTLQLEVYSTWPLLEGVLRYGKSMTILEPDVGATRENVFKGTDGVLHVPLGDPVLRVGVQDVVDPDRSSKYGQVMGEWVRMDRQNIVNRWGKVHWIQGPEDHKTNELLSEYSRFRLSFFWNAMNLESSLRNFTRVATLLRLEMSQFNQNSDKKLDSLKVDALDNVLQTLWTELGPSARSAITQHLEGTWPGEPQSGGDLLADFLYQAD